ncbi:MAG TPA: hypothetical protein VK149_13270 [Sideroxyarcus sp.]|nr:hypothetical protein [Sideroxyarcus sp.]
MRYVSDIPSVTPNTTARQVSGLSATHAVKPVHPFDEPVTYVEQHAEHQPLPQQLPQAVAPSLPPEDRRTYCRRVSHQHVLIELRSGVERRRHNLFEGGADEHIDIKA